MTFDMLLDDYAIYTYHKHLILPGISSQMSRNIL